MYVARRTSSGRRSAEERLPEMVWMQTLNVSFVDRNISRSSKKPCNASGRGKCDGVERSGTRRNPAVCVRRFFSGKPICDAAYGTSPVSALVNLAHNKTKGELGLGQSRKNLDTGSEQLDRTCDCNYFTFFLCSVCQLCSS